MPTGRIGLLGIRDAPLSIDAALGAVRDPAAGAVVLFIGEVRDDDGGRAVRQLDYSAHPRVELVLREIAESVAAMPGVVAVAAEHRVGALSVGDLAVTVAVSSVHRAEGFAACRRFIDELKNQVPIWKHQLFDDGGEEWVGSP